MALGGELPGGEVCAWKISMAKWSKNDAQSHACLKVKVDIQTLDSYVFPNLLTNLLLQSTP